MTGAETRSLTVAVRHAQRGHDTGMRQYRKCGEKNIVQSGEGDCRNIREAGKTFPPSPVSRQKIVLVRVETGKKRHERRE